MIKTYLLSSILLVNLIGAQLNGGRFRDPLA